MQQGNFTVLATSAAAVPANIARMAVTIWAATANSGTLWLGLGGDEALTSGANPIAAGGALVIEGAIAQGAIAAVGTSGDKATYQEA